MQKLPDRVEVESMGAERDRSGDGWEEQKEAKKVKVMETAKEALQI